MDNILKNPTFIAVVIGTLTYTYLSWKKNNKNKKKIQSNNNDLLYAFIVAVIVWFLSYGYINHQNIPKNIEQPQNIPTYKLVKELSESPKSFTLMNKSGGLVMPLGNNPLPEVFIDNF